MQCIALHRSCPAPTDPLAPGTIQPPTTRTIKRPAYNISTSCKKQQVLNLDMLPTRMNLVLVMQCACTPPRGSLSVSEPVTQVNLNYHTSLRQFDEVQSSWELT